MSFVTSGTHGDRDGLLARYGKDAAIHPVRLYFMDPRCDSPNYRPLEPGDELYPVAAVACRIQDRLAHDERRALMIGLSHVWPQAQGHRSERDHRSLVVIAALRAGRTVDEIANEFCVEADTVRRWRTHGERLIDDESGAWARRGVDPAVPRVETEWPEQEPPNCGDDLSYMRWLAASPAQARTRFDDFQRLEKLR